jgi:phage shock protein C
MSRKNWKGHMGCGWRGARWNADSSASAAWSEGGFGGGRNFRILSGLRRDPYRGRVSGVCAGIAGYYGINLKLIRIAMIVALFINPLLTIGGYALATYLIQPLPEPTPDGGHSEANAGTSAQRAEREKAAEEDLPPELRFAALKDKFRELEERTGQAETLVTSPEFRLRRDFKNMGEGPGNHGDEGDSASRPSFGAGPNARPPMMGLVG